MTLTTRATYDEIASRYHQRNSGGFAGLDEDLDDFCRALPQAARVADLGCGPGRDLRLLRERGLRAVGMDLSWGMLRAGGLTGVAQGDLRALPVRSGSLDGVWCQAALLHVPRVDAPVVLAEFARVLRPGGAVHLAVAEGDDEGWQTDQYDGQPRWFTLHRAETLRAALVRTGFTVRDIAWRQSYRNWLRVRAARIR